MDIHQQGIIELGSRLDRLGDGIENIKIRQEEMADNVSEIKKAVYHPDLGIYARLRGLETWKSSSTRLIWILSTSLIGLLTATLWSKLIN